MHLLATLGTATHKSLNHVYLLHFLSLSHYKSEVASLICQTHFNSIVVLPKANEWVGPSKLGEDPKTATDEITISIVNSPCRHPSTGPQ